MKGRTSIGVPAIAESLLKRKWTLMVLRYLHGGSRDPLGFCSIDPGISQKVLNDRLRTLLRYELIVRSTRMSSSVTTVEYQLTDLGEKMVDMMNVLEQLDREYQEIKYKKSPVEESMSA